MNKMNFGHKLSLLLAISIVMVLVYFFVLRPAADALLGWRLTLNAHTMPGTRSAQLVLALSNISMRSFLWGLDSTGITDVLAFKDKFGIMAENPLGPLVTSGIFVSFPYYYFMIRLFLTGIRHREQNIYLAVALLFLPRPYVTSYGYSVLAMLFLLSLDKGFLNRS